MPLVIENPKLLLNQMRHPRTSPQWCLIAEPFRTPEEKLAKPRSVLLAQPGFSAGPAGSLQGLLAVFPVCGYPSHHRLSRHFQPPGDLRLVDSVREQPHRLKSPPLERLKIAPYSARIPDRG